MFDFVRVEEEDTVVDRERAFPSHFGTIGGAVGVAARFSAASAAPKMSAFQFREGVPG